MSYGEYKLQHFFVNYRNIMNIDEACLDEGFFKLGEHKIRNILKQTKRLKIDTSKRIIEGLWNEYGERSLNFFVDMNLDIDLDQCMENEEKSNCYEIMKEILNPVLEIKMFGFKIFKYLIEYIEWKTSKENDRIECEIEIDWEHEYEKLKKEIEKLKEEHIGCAKVLRMQYESIGKMKASNLDDSIKKYERNDLKRNRCFEIFRQISLGCIKITDRTHHHIKKLVINPKKEETDPLFTVIKRAIKANDCPAVMALYKGCYLPSNRIIRLKSIWTSCSLFKYSCMVRADECSFFLLKAGGGIEQRFENEETPLHQSVIAGNELLSAFLIEEGANIEASDCCGKRILHVAAYNNKLNIARILLEKGVNIDAKDIAGYTPLHCAAQKNHFEFARLLIEHGANLNYEDDTPLHCAAANNSIETIKLLIEKGFNIDAKGINDETPLLRAIHCMQAKAYNYLIKKGANIKAKNKYGITPLHNAAKNNLVDLIKVLIELGADLEEQTEVGDTPLHYAARSGCKGSMELLIEKGANVEAKNHEGKTPLQLMTSEKKWPYTVVLSNQN